MRYEDFTVSIVGRRGDAYRVEISSPAGESWAEVRLTRPLDEMVARARSLGRVVRGGGEARAAERSFVPDAASAPGPSEVGRTLFEDLFTGAARSLFDQSLGIVRGSSAGLRIKLRFDPADPEVARLAQLPWELLYREETRDYLSLSRATPLVRYLEVPRPFAPLPFEPPLRVLVAMASPEGAAPLDLERERSLVEKSWARQSGVDVDFVTAATVQELSQRLGDGDYHVLHFMGHGAFDRQKGVGALLFEREGGGADPVSGTTLGMLLRDEPTMRLVFLNACDTGRAAESDEVDPFAGVATALVMAGLPAVVAMQFPVSDSAAVEFSACFYSRLARGAPVDSAVAEGRKAIRLAHEESFEWATPVLFMRAPDGVLFEPVGVDSAAVPEQRPPEAGEATVEPPPPGAGAGGPTAEPGQAAPAPGAPTPATTRPRGGRQWLRPLLWALLGAALLVVAVIVFVPAEDGGEPSAQTAAGEALVEDGSADRDTGSGAAPATGPADRDEPGEPVRTAAAGPVRLKVDHLHGFQLVTADMRLELRSRGIEVSAFEDASAFDELVAGDVVGLWLARTEGKPDFTDDQIAALDRHVRDGGGLLLVGLGWVWAQYEQRPMSQYPLNRLAEPFGVSFDDDYVRSTVDGAPLVFDPATMADHAVTAGLRRLHAPGGVPGSLAVRPPAVRLVWGGDDVVGGGNRGEPVIAAASEVGRGRVVCLQHADYLKIGWPENDGVRLLVNAVEWLAGRSALSGG